MISLVEAFVLLHKQKGSWEDMLFWAEKAIKVKGGGGEREGEEKVGEEYIRLHIYTQREREREIDG